MKTQVSLIPYQSFGVQAIAAKLGEFSTLDQLQVILQEMTHPFLLLGAGSNVLFVGDYPGTVLINRMKGIEILDRQGETVYVRAAAGEYWHSFVLQTLQVGLGGLENLSLIPGTVGASPIQNIGAYGVELKDVFHQLQAYDLQTGKYRTFGRQDCQFGYRDSFFKRTEHSGRYIITHVDFCLSTDPKLSLEYGAIQRQLQQMGVSQPSIHDVSRAVIAIRSAKLPDPSELGNAGSFFKNPVIAMTDFINLQCVHNNIPHYPVSEKQVKVPAGWLIEQCGWKGKRMGKVGCHEHQSLVIVNYGGATGEEVWNHAQRVANSVADQFGIVLEPEVTLIKEA